MRHWLAKPELDPKVLADMMGHDLSVNLNDYTKTDLSQLAAVASALEQHIFQGKDFGIKGITLKEPAVVTS